jgi:hypothetical protein
MQIIYLKKKIRPKKKHEKEKHVLNFNVDNLKKPIVNKYENSQ